MSHPLLLGHRGARLPHGPPENTFAAFDLALGVGCDGFEFDVRLSGDGCAVICHDPQHHGLNVAHSTSTQLRLPSLQDVLKRYQHRGFFDIELKVPGLEQAALSALAATPPYRGFVLSSFLPDVLIALYQRDPDLPLGLICETPRQLSRWQELRLQYLIAHVRLSTRELLDSVHARHKSLFVWTVNTREDILRFAKWGVGAIISDDPQLLAATRNGNSR